jgi:acid stress-induced BolA-like protein IbaG/YrbA
MGRILRFVLPKRKTRKDELMDAVEGVRCERAKAHARWRELDNEVHALNMAIYAEAERERASKTKG